MPLPGPGHSYDLVVVGAGVSGSEAAYAAARAGLDVLLVTTSLDTVYNLVGDGAPLRPPPDTLMAELHAGLAGLADGTEHVSTGHVTTGYINTGYINTGYINTWELHRRAKYALEHQPGIHLLQSSVSSLLTEAGAVRGVATWEGVDRRAPRVVLCVGSFLAARLTVGSLTETAGRLSEMAYDDLYENLVDLRFEMESLTLEAPPSSGALPYTVACKHFAPTEWEATSFALPRLRGLYGAGVCVAGALSYEAAARQGRALADVLTRS